MSVDSEGAVLHARAELRDARGARGELVRAPGERDLDEGAAPSSPGLRLTASADLARGAGSIGASDCIQLESIGDSHGLALFG